MGLWEAYFRAYSGGVLSRSGAIYTLSYVQMAQGPLGPWPRGPQNRPQNRPILRPPRSPYLGGSPGFSPDSQGFTSYSPPGGPQKGASK